MTEVREPPIIDFNTELNLALDRFREAVTMEKTLIREGAAKRCDQLDEALIKATLAIRSVADMPSMLQAGDDDQVALAVVLKRLEKHSRGDMETNGAQVTT